MLLELMVENYAVVEKIRLRFHPGLNVLTGETGSGKSIVVDALGLLFGARTSSESIRSGAARARVAGIFELPADAQPTLDEAGIDTSEAELLVEREILPNGKSRAFVNNKPATASLLRELAASLGDIHGQHEQQRLFSASAQLELLDSAAGIGPPTDRIADVYRRWKQASDQLSALDRDEQEKLRLLDLLTFQRNEIEAARLRSGEDVELEAERKVLQNVTKLAELANTAFEALYESPDSVSTQLRTVARKVEELCRIDDSLEPVLASLKPAQIAVEDASGSLRDYLGRLEADPSRLEEVEGRLAAIQKLQRKYGATVDDILRFGEDVQSQIAAVESAATRRAELEKERGQLASEYAGLSAELTALRTRAAASLAKKVQSELKSLAMERTVFEVRLSKTAWSSSGEDAVEFFISPNLGETPKPLDKIASGGELSRVALALKTCASTAARGRTLVFDEVDAGIGGAAATSVAKKLKSLAGANQVLCVTHLAAIAGFADHHYAVEKREAGQRTQTHVEELVGEGRTREIGRMISGHRLTPEALRHAEQLIKAGSL